ncbi:MAG: hypothetical protein JWM19_3656 [Actinomycetia bacterium]|nr:hypothetical protein [Actinomycetes bacterium]
MTGVAVAADAAGERFTPAFQVARGSWQREPLSSCHGTRFEEALPARPFRFGKGLRSFAPIDPGMLADLPGCEPHAILRAFPELATREDIQRSRAAKREKYAAIRSDASNGMSERAIERRHHVGRRTIIRALASADPPERKKIHREAAALPCTTTLRAYVTSRRPRMAADSEQAEKEQA